MTTLQEIADLAGVSVETVSRVLRGKYRQKGVRGIQRVAQVERIANELGYRPNSAARSMKNKSSMMVGVVLPVDANSRLAHAVSMEIVFGLNSVLTDSRYVMSLLPVSNDEIKTGQPLSRGLREQMVDGFIVIDDIGEQLESHIRANDKPIVWANVDRRDSNACVHRDERRAGEMALQALADAGHRRVLSIERVAGQGMHYSFAMRRDGIQDAAKRNQIDLRTTFVSLRRDAPRPNDLPEAVRSAGAVVFSDVYLSIRVIGELSLAGLGVCDYSAVSCDDADELKETLPWLTRSSFNRFEMGVHAARLLLRLIAGESVEPIVLQPSLIPGGSIALPEQ
ncbi:LacI family DNA-binding transcriptional regulator [Neorhodopirellula pilleata]|uniref:Catabolite control protein A n=1 Tax=Neorhodopirellula pilleata TaxID=2714738 RepID=A0A5C5ZH52_9BACT|nr:LacI family DNA-binding transcriptional regulator [Neorhodopirellula pilleata]TWT86387.1 Catabolite control protein A [Neorhodopirellula pilleata]